jgi:hypothetical protein
MTKTAAEKNVTPAKLSVASASKAAKPARPEEKPQKKKLSLRARLTVQVSRMQVRSARLGRAFVSYGTDEATTAGKAMNEAAGWLDVAAKTIEKLPEDFRRGATARASERFAPGVTVEVAERYQSVYEGAFEADDMRHLEVVKVVGGGKRVVVKTADGLRTVIPGLHLRPVADAAE